jgi:hypothetical protein
MLEIPSAEGASGSEVTALRGAVKGATCDYLVEAFNTGRLPSARYFFSSLQMKFSRIGTPAQNQMRAIQNTFTNLQSTLSGRRSMHDAAKSLACSYIPG